MACNCGSRKTTNSTGAPIGRLVYTLTEPNGHRRSYATQAEADAAKRRLGGEVTTSR